MKNSGKFQIWAILVQNFYNIFIIYFTKSFKNDIFIYVNPCPMNLYYIFSTAQPDLSLKYKTHSLKINKSPIFSEITQVLQYLKMCL